ncbi:ATP-binding cassette sub- B member 10, mitochondrial [Phlyctochytrium bullatum]|nr:ATP-binding cassette sub- B member 10, mitochondrial [Phlyctochytrium bullatum]
MSVMAYVNLKLTLIMMTIVPPVALAAIWYGRLVRQLSKQTQDAIGETTKFAEEKVGNMRTVRAFSREAMEIDRYSDRVKDVYNISVREGLANGLFFGGMGLSGNVVMLAILYYGGSMVQTRPEAPIFKDLSFAVEPGTHIAIVGHSGSGKSTVAQLLLRMYDPEHGSVTIDGFDIRCLDPSYLREDLCAFVSQEPILFAATIRENIAYGRPQATEDEIVAAADIANARGFIEGFPAGFETFVGEKGMALSGGQKQRIAIARALIKNPKILIMDEATSALDAASEMLVQEAMGRIVEGRTVITIAHRLSTIQQADVVVMIADGQVVEVGPYDELVQKSGGHFRALVESQLSATLVAAKSERKNNAKDESHPSRLAFCSAGIENPVFIATAAEAVMEEEHSAPSDVESKAATHRDMSYVQALMSMESDSGFDCGPRGKKRKVDDLKRMDFSKVQKPEFHLPSQISPWARNGSEYSTDAVVSAIDVMICKCPLPEPRSLYVLASALRYNRVASELETRTEAHIPSIYLVDSLTGFSVNISFLKPAGVRPVGFVTKVLDDPMCGRGVRGLMFMLKHFLGQKGLYDKSSGGLGSYALYLLVVAFVKNHPRVRMGNLRIEENMGRLFLEFLEFYGDRFCDAKLGISFDKDAIPLFFHKVANDVGSSVIKYPEVKRAFKYAHRLLSSAIGAEDTSDEDEPILTGVLAEQEEPISMKEDSSSYSTTILGKLLVVDNQLLARRDAVHRIAEKLFSGAMDSGLNPFDMEPWRKITREVEDFAPQSETRATGRRCEPECIKRKASATPQKAKKKVKNDPKPKPGPGWEPLQPSSPILSWPKAPEEYSLNREVSDVDVEVYRVTAKYRYSNKKQSQYYLKALESALRSSHMAVNITLVGKARVPIIRMVDSLTKYPVDISFNNDSGAKGVALVKDVLDDPTVEAGVRGLMQILKLFLGKRRLLNRKSGGLGSHTLFLLVVAFLKDHHLIRKGRSDKSVLERYIGKLLLDFLEFYGCRFREAELGISFGKDLMPIFFDKVKPPTDVGSGTKLYAEIKAAFKGAYRRLSLFIEDPYRTIRSTILEEFISHDRKLVDQRDDARRIARRVFSGKIQAGVDTGDEESWSKIRKALDEFPPRWGA